MFSTGPIFSRLYSSLWPFARWNPPRQRIIALLREWLASGEVVV